MFWRWWVERRRFLRKSLTYQRNSALSAVRLEPARGEGERSSADDRKCVFLSLSPGLSQWRHTEYHSASKQTLAPKKAFATQLSGILVVRLGTRSIGASRQAI
ncbi:unnamed protein product [Fusarium graminearum]|uniref:Uncharacterized protein n=1 Tax=Gibberella zeae TaxID=5518 RepID=A0A4E9DWJ6_GIBZA|nr:unnamed protein product [Fusarium graminearum]